MCHSDLEGFNKLKFRTKSPFFSWEKRSEFRRFIRTPHNRYGLSSSLSTVHPHATTSIIFFIEFNFRYMHIPVTFFSIVGIKFGDAMLGPLGGVTLLLCPVKGCQYACSLERSNVELLTLILAIFNFVIPIFAIWLTAQARAQEQ